MTQIPDFSKIPFGASIQDDRGAWEPRGGGSRTVCLPAHIDGRAPSLSLSRW